MEHEHGSDDLCGLSRDELVLRLREALASSEDPENDEAVEAIEDAILAAERKKPTGLIPDSGEDLRDLLARLPRRERAGRRIPRAVTAIFRYGVAAVLAVAVTLGGMMTAEAAGHDVFGTLSELARSAREVERTGYTVEVSTDGNSRRFTGMPLSRKAGPETVQYLDEDSAVDYIVTVEALEVNGDTRGLTPVYIHLLVGGLMAGQEPVEGPCTFTLHGGAGSCVISAVANADVTIDFTIERVPQGGE